MHPFLIQAEGVMLSHTLEATFKRLQDSPQVALLSPRFPIAGSAA